MISRILNSMSNYEGGMMQNVSAMSKDDEEALKAQQANVRFYINVYLLFFTRFDYFLNAFPLNYKFS